MLAIVTEARVRFARQASDGNYGSETISVDVTISSAVDNGRVENEEIAEVLHSLRQHVEEELAHSPNWSVQRSVEYPKPQGEPMPTTPREFPTAEELEEPPF